MGEDNVKALNIESESMKKLIFAVCAILLCLIGAWIAVGRYTMATHADKIWTRESDTLACSPADAGYYCVDVYVKADGTPMLMRSSDTTDVVPIDSYLRYLGKEPQGKLWMRLHGLTDDNMMRFVQSFGNMGWECGVRDSQFILESSDWALLGSLTKHRLCVAYHLVADDPSVLTERQKDSVVTRLDRVVESDRVSAIDMPRSWYGILRRQYRNRDVRFLVRVPGRSPWHMTCSPATWRVLRDQQVRGIVED